MDDLTSKALELGKLLVEHRGKDVAVIDLRNISSWTDFFVVATVGSTAHCAGLQRRIKDWCAAENMALPRGIIKDDTWSFADMGDIVVHLMTESTRSFYELENLWSEGKTRRIPDSPDPSEKPHPSDQGN